MPDAFVDQYPANCCAPPSPDDKLIIFTSVVLVRSVAFPFKIIEALCIDPSRISRLTASTPSNPADSAAARLAYNVCPYSTCIVPLTGKKYISWRVYLLLATVDVASEPLL